MRLSARLGLAGLAAALAAPALIAQQPPGSDTKAEQPKERRICRRTTESGSLAKVRRQCLTRAQWDRLAQDQRNNSPAMTAFSGSQSGQ